LDRPKFFGAGTFAATAVQIYANLRPQASQISHGAHTGVRTGQFQRSLVS